MSEEFVENQTYREYFANHPDILAKSTIDINANISRMVIDGLATMKEFDNFGKKYANTLVSFIEEAFDGLSKIIYKDKKYTLIDTAGIRKKKSVEEDLEYYSVLRALGAIRRADVCIIMIDASVGVTEQDVKICGYVHEQGKPSIIVMNKWDLIEKDTNTINAFNKDLNEA